jgi:hypothetical protein
MQQPMGDAPEEHAGNRAVPVRARDDEIATRAIGDADNCVRGAAEHGVSKLNLGLDPAIGELFGFLLDLLADLTLVDVR